MTRQQVLWGTLFTVLGAVVTALAEAFIVPWVQAMSFTSVSESGQAILLKVTRFLTSTVEISVLTIALLTVGAFVLLGVIRAFRQVADAQLPPPSLTESKIKELMKVAESADIIETIHPDGTITPVRSVPQDGLSEDARRFMRVLSLANTEPIPLPLVSTVFAHNKVAMLVALQSLKNKGLIDTAADHVTLTPSGLEWANRQLRAGLAEASPLQLHVPATVDQECAISEEHKKILIVLSRETGSMTMGALLAKTRLSKVRLEHFIDQLEKFNLVKRYSGGYSEHGVTLTPEGRSYAVANNLDLGLRAS